MITMKELSRIYKDADSFIDYLPWLEYEDGYFVLIDGAIGQMYEIECLSSDLNGREITGICSAEFRNIVFTLTRGNSNAVYSNV